MLRLVYTCVIDGLFETDQTKDGGGINDLSAPTLQWICKHVLSNKG